MTHSLGGIVGKSAPLPNPASWHHVQQTHLRANFDCMQFLRFSIPSQTTRKRLVECTLQVIDMPSPMLQGWQLTSSICRTLTLCRRPAADFISDAFSSCDCSRRIRSFHPEALNMLSNFWIGVWGFYIAKSRKYDKLPQLHKAGLAPKVV